jgi:PEP-CTERM motif
MKKLGIFATVIGIFSFVTAKADNIATWTFETSASTNNIIGAGLNVSGAQSGVDADVGTGTASSSHAQATSVWSIPAGNGSSHSWSVNSNSVGDYLQFQVSTTDFQDIQVSYDQNGSSTGPDTYYFAYSTDGSSFTQFGADYNLTSGITWSAGTADQPTQLSFDLSGVTALDDSGTVYFRIVDDGTTSINGGTVGAAGTDRVDNFTVNANPVPEPSTLALGLVAALAGLVARRRKS